MSQFTSRDFKRPEHNQFYKELSLVDPSGGRDFYKLFEDFLLLAATSLAQLTHRFLHGGALDEKLEAEYMERVGQYKKDKVIHFTNAMRIMEKGIQTEIHDFLGDVYSCTGIASKWGGQFFTPWPLCEMMAAMVVNAAIPGAKRLTVQEPAVGGGAMLLAVADYLHNERGFSAHQWWFDATDVDVRCFHMAYVQLSTLGVCGVVRHGNSISLEQWRAWLTPAGAMFPMRWPKEENAAEVIVPVNSPEGQMDLF